MKSIYKIVFVADPFTITRKDGTPCQKQLITLRELGGKYEDQYVATWLSDKPLHLNEGATIAASLRFSTRTYEGQDYQDITLQEYVVVDPNYSPGQLPSVPVL